MEVRTSRFGTVNISDDRVITFPKGLLGFAECKRCASLEPAEDACFFWLQSGRTRIWHRSDDRVPEYRCRSGPSRWQLGLARLDDAQSRPWSSARSIAS